MSVTDGDFARDLDPVPTRGVVLSAAFAAARQICRAHARSFYFASAFLPRAKREAAFAVYAFCRMIDDAIDAPAGGDGAAPPGTAPSAAAHALDHFIRRLDQVYEGRLELSPLAFRTPEQHALLAFAATVHQFHIPKFCFLDLAEGCRMDLTVCRYATWQSLEQYCYRVAGVVGLMMSRVLGLHNPAAVRQAVQMGNAMQLTNILRDVGEDWQRGRLYLPLDELARFGYREADLAAGVVNASFRALMAFQIDRARHLYRQGAGGLCWLEGDGSRLTASAMAVLYGGILDAIERADYDVFRIRAHLTGGQKVRRLAAAWRLAAREDGQPVPDVWTKG